MVRLGRTRNRIAARLADVAGSFGRKRGEESMIRLQKRRMSGWPVLVASVLWLAHRLVAAAPLPVQPQSVAKAAELTEAASATMTLYRNGRIYTNDPADPWAQTILVRGEEILAVGDDEVEALADKDAKVVDLEKHFVMPGF